uniref:Uncharacterized protein n=1 Tax=Vespula pensylvanica TaxID=30213 RepID=A0A834PAH3_VESPE|nr:hypothetical protein H0235_002708 [Vespula pensylvanica]
MRLRRWGFQLAASKAATFTAYFQLASVGERLEGRRPEAWNGRVGIHRRVTQSNPVNACQVATLDRVTRSSEPLPGAAGFTAARDTKMFEKEEEENEEEDEEEEEEEEEDEEEEDEEEKKE